MIRSLAGGLIALFMSSCVLDGEKQPDHVGFQLDPVLLGLTRVEIFRLDAQGRPIAPALFDDSLRALADVGNLDARGYGGGSAAFTVKGYKAAEMVYEIKVTSNGKAATVQEIKLIPLHSVTLNIADGLDQDKDGFKSGYNLVADANTNLADDTVMLRYWWKKDGAADWESRGASAPFRISKLSPDDAMIKTMEGGEKSDGTLKVEAYDMDNLLLAGKILPIREESADQDDPGFHFLLINNTGAFMEASLTVSGEVQTKDLAPRDTLRVDKATRPDRVSYYAAADGGVVVWEDSVPIIDQATYRSTLILANNTDEFFVATVVNNSDTRADRIVVDQGLPTEAAVVGPIPGDGVSYNLGIFNFSPTATITFFNDSTGRSATIHPLQFDISPTYGYRYASVTLSSSNWVDPAVNLAKRNWKLIGSSIEPAMKDTATGTLFTDVYARMQGCARDGILQFNSDGTFTDDEGPTKCAETNAQSIKGTWSLNTARTQLTMQWGSDTAPMVFAVKALTPTTLGISNNQDTWGDGKVHDLTMTFSAM